MKTEEGRKDVWFTSEIPEPGALGGNSFLHMDTVAGGRNVFGSSGVDHPTGRTPVAPPDGRIRNGTLRSREKIAACASLTP